ncbi:MAG: hypothetical protein ACRDK4_11430 [Solirubrobacteraceae bacterium]
MTSQNDAVRTLVVAAVSVLPEHLDVFTGANGGIAIGGVLGGVVAVLRKKDIAQGGLVGGSIGLVLGAIVAGAQSKVLA